MNDEDGFLQKLRDNPADDTTRLVYADWLDERGDPVSGAKAEFLRLTVRLLEPNRDAREEGQLQELATALLAEWRAVVSRLKVENCETSRDKQGVHELWKKYGLRFNVVCERRWDELMATPDEQVRHCDECNRSVYYCHTIDGARERAWKGDCVAVDLGVIRHERDLEEPLMLLGAIAAPEIE
jgi:uncharacterized protein (TIGR02996 family)